MRRLFATEDWWAVWLGLLLVALAMPVTAGFDALGWVVKTNVGSRPARPWSHSPRPMRMCRGSLSLALTFLFLLALVSVGAYAQGFNLKRFIPAFSVVFGISFLCWLLGHYAYIAQTPDKRAAMGISWSLGLTGEAGYIVALLAGLAIGNFLPALAGGSRTPRGPSGSSRRRSSSWGPRWASRRRGPPGSCRPSCFAAWRRSSRRT